MSILIGDYSIVITTNDEQFMLQIVNKCLKLIPSNINQKLRIMILALSVHYGNCLSNLAFYILFRKKVYIEVKVPSFELAGGMICLC